MLKNKLPLSITLGSLFYQRSASNAAKTAKCGNINIARPLWNPLEQCKTTEPGIYR